MSYVTVFLSQLAIIGGTLTYHKFNVDGALLSFLHCGFFFSLLIAYEFCFKFIHRKKVEFIIHPNKMTVKEFEERLKKGE